MIYKTHIIENDMAVVVILIHVGADDIFVFAFKDRIGDPRPDLMGLFRIRDLPRLKGNFSSSVTQKRTGTLRVRPVGGF